MNTKFYKKLLSVFGKNQAFSLVEVIISLLFITTILAIALPKLTNSLAHYQTITTVRQLVSDIQFTQQLATKSEDPYAGYEIFFKPTKEQYLILHGTKTLRTVTFPNAVDLAGTNLSQGGKINFLSFNIQGNPLNAGTITIINRRSGKGYFIHITVLTGRIRVDTT
ncbi:hypothetical protein Dred_1025 [Desulforamulus reducens MI-1]|uniref:Prepilin-type N-terminal cleavage/methylation domain-containing protein n=1 Tax=Desulforamulus reducens (strain ATCC BAA-1160 / DSM 100696 / MI-1) TaxID=349161 RepID=A4J3A7_DESRM|nr:GspH/FimT family protein [Desulforamulus reducens]ABO49560.1 hypothetical protein Dred_1025 [Desulforamulus reducens MI-1]